MDKKQMERIWNLAVKLYPICRSITGDGVRKTLEIISEIIQLKIHEIPTGEKVLDWEIPKEWEIRDAYIVDPDGKKIVNFKDHNLHIVSYSIPIDEEMTLDELEKHLHSLPLQPDAIPYVTSYYEENWGFCLSHNLRKKLKKGVYRVLIDSELKAGSLTYGELIIKGKSKEEIFLSSYICHPSMANNEVSGPVVLAFISEWLFNRKNDYTIRVVFTPETIGSIAYLSKNLIAMKERVKVGFNLSCVGDTDSIGFISTRYSNTLADRLTENILKFKYSDYQKYSYLKRGSDERQYCGPGVDLPLVTICRSKFGDFPEYHTSLDDLNFISKEGLTGTVDFVKELITTFEKNKIYVANCLGEPQMGKRGIYPTISKTGSTLGVRPMMDFLSYCDGKNDLIEISEIIKKPTSDLLPLIEILLAHKLIFEKKGQKLK